MSNVNGEQEQRVEVMIAPATINLPRLGILAKGDIDRFLSC